MELNLLPTPRKRKVESDIRQIVLINNTLVISLVIIVISILLILCQKYLDYKIVQINEVGILGTKQSDIGEINNTMSEVNTVQEGYVKWSRVIQNFLSLVPEGNQIESLEFDKTNQKLVITGLASTREAFLKLEENLKMSDLLGDIKSPISNLLYQTDINFSLEAKLNL